MLLFVFFAVCFGTRFVIEDYNSENCEPDSLVGMRRLQWRNAFSGQTDIRAEGGDCFQLNQQASSRVICSNDEASAETFDNPSCRGEPTRTQAIDTGARGCVPNPMTPNMWRHFRCDADVPDNFAHMLMYRLGESACDGNYAKVEEDIFVKVGECVRRMDRAWNVEQLGEQNIEMKVYGTQYCNGTEEGVYRWTHRNQCRNHEGPGGPTRRAVEMGAGEFLGMGGSSGILVSMVVLALVTFFLF